MAQALARKQGRAGSIARSYDPDSVTRLEIAARRPRAAAKVRSVREEPITRPDLAPVDDESLTGLDVARQPTVVDPTGLEKSGLRPATPRVVGAYRLSPPIASGGMATVHLAVREDDTNRLYAIKRLFPNFATDQSFVEMLLDEATIGARIRHENVVAVHGATMIEGELLVVMDYVAGVSLGDLIREVHPQSLPPRFVAAIMAGALRGLHGAHEAVDDQGCPLAIVHRDVSPQNIHVGIDGIGRVLDFGIAKAAHRFQRTRTGELKGKLAYMAPEQLRAKAVDRRADVRAAAVVLWEALVGEPLFHGEDEGTTMARVLDGTAKPPSELVAGVPPMLDAIVMRGLASQPEDRFQTALEMAEALDAAFASNPVHPSEIGVWLSTVATEPLREQWQVRARLQGKDDGRRALKMAARTARPSLPLVKTAPSFAAPHPIHANDDALDDEDQIVTVRRVSRLRRIVEAAPAIALVIAIAMLTAVLVRMFA